MENQDSIDCTLFLLFDRFYNFSIIKVKEVYKFKSLNKTVRLSV